LESKVLGRLSRLSIALITLPDSQAEVLTRVLQRSRAEIRRYWPCPQIFDTDADILVCDFFPGLERRLPWNPGEAKAAVVLVLPGGGQPDADAIHAALPDGILTRPIQESAVLPVVSMAWDHFSYHRRQSERIDQLDESIRTLREIERAKTILMQDRKISEANAFEALRKEAMRRRIKVSVVAKTIIDGASNDR